jgi:hypothetical protein
MGWQIKKSRSGGLVERESLKVGQAINRVIEKVYKRCCCVVVVTFVIVVFYIHGRRY